MTTIRINALLTTGTLLFLVIALFMLTDVEARSCTTDSDCGEHDCCIEYLPYIYRCKDMGDDDGDRCGGQFHCGCTKGLKCIEDNPSFWNYLKFGMGDCVSEKLKTRYDGGIEIVNLQK